MIRASFQFYLDGVHMYGEITQKTNNSTRLRRIRDAWLVLHKPSRSHIHILT